MPGREHPAALDDVQGSHGFGACDRATHQHPNARKDDDGKKQDQDQHHAGRCGHLLGVQRNAERRHRQSEGDRKQHQPDHDENRRKQVDRHALEAVDDGLSDRDGGR